MENFNLGDFYKDAEQETDRLISLLDLYIANEKKRPPLTFIDSSKKEEVVEERLRFLKEKARTKQALSDAITFKNPLVWLLYKRRAYRDLRRQFVNGGVEIRTLQDLIEHTNNDGICARRFDYLNKVWRKMFDGKNISEFVEEFGKPSEIDLEEIARFAKFLQLASDQQVVEEWSKYEGYREGENLKKWGNYVRGD